MAQFFFLLAVLTFVLMFLVLMMWLPRRPRLSWHQWLVMAQASPLLLSQASCVPSLLRLSLKGSLARQLGQLMGHPMLHVR